MTNLTETVARAIHKRFGRAHPFGADPVEVEAMLMAASVIIGKVFVWMAEPSEAILRDRVARSDLRDARSSDREADISECLKFYRAMIFAMRKEALE